MVNIKPPAKGARHMNRKFSKNKKIDFRMSRRQVLKAGLYGGAGLMLPWRFLPAKAFADDACGILGCDITLNDPDSVDKFVNGVPDALDPTFKYNPVGMGRGRVSLYRVGVSQNNNHIWGTTGNQALTTEIYGYGGTWPGMTFEVQSGVPVQVQWMNNLEPNGGHLLPVDTSLHWCYSLHGYTQYSIAENGVPIVVHVHGHHSQYRSDGNPEEFFTYRERVKGPRFRGSTYIYDNSQPAGNLWYHDHALGITRLNVYAGMAGFYFVRDDMDTGLPGNPLDLPAHPYEKAYAIQDRMFASPDNGGYAPLFYPAFPGDPAYADFITGEGATLEPPQFPIPEPGGGGPTALAEFFGDHMVVNGVAWPKEYVEPRNYRLHLLNGCDSRFMAIQFFEVPANAANFNTVVKQLNFTVIGSDQGLGSSPETVSTLVFEPGSRYDIIIDFNEVTPNNRVIMKNIGGDEPFGGDLVSDDPALQIFDHTDKIMAFDVVVPLDTTVPDVSPTGINFGPDVGTPTRTRRVALFEGKDEFGRLQPLLGTAEPATDFIGRPINWPDTAEYRDVGLTGQMNGASAWHSPTTENPALNTTEEWEIWNGTGDAHPVHLHLVHFEIVGRKAIIWDSATTEEDRVLDPADANGDGTYLVEQSVVQHNGEIGMGFRFENLTAGADVDLTPAQGYVENARHDMVTALPDQVTIIKAKFDKPGRFVWHCHILSHEDHEMMKTLYVGPVTGP
jgi:FtsP/CotA-like multicopper oxidase with cupredoxin domain